MMQALPSSDPTESTGNGPIAVHNGNEHDVRTGVDDHSDVANEELLVVWQGIALLTADCMGVGVLGLPNDIKSLGYVAGFTFLLGNFPINYYAGNLLSVLALDLEHQHKEQHRIHHGHDDDDDVNEDNVIPTTESTPNGLELAERSSPQHSETFPVPSSSPINSPIKCRRKSNEGKNESLQTNEENDVDSDYFKQHCGEEVGSFEDEIADDDHDLKTTQLSLSAFSAPPTNITKDLINITEVTFYPSSGVATTIVKVIFYINLFLVLGDYVLVMGRSISAVFADQICLPSAGAIASFLMFGLCQFRTMANLGRSVSLASLLALLVVLIQCLFHHRMGSPTGDTDTIDDGDIEMDDGIWGKFSSLAGIGFAVGSQKLFLNIRNELRQRDQASKVLAGSLGVYGVAYVAVILLAGPDPPSFLFDSIPEGWNRRLAGLLLWFHVAVSYAINSQALCASLDQLFVRRSYSSSTPFWSKTHPATRWFTLTLAVSLFSYVVSNAIPFFKALVGLIGALTSVPLSLTLPAILHRQALRLSLFLPDWSCASTDSYLLFIYSLFFLVVGLVGAISSIKEDWMKHGRPFSCS
ncbi:transmembrane amino acid transporter [Nitzschia inconspicua]|uniref:Transmembrane amino acid transporter n=1 Tax=Nitzschia inconspicua TaxID=303405 RepID=A0A9K3PFH1_9STRA|nr:transmembrane amino acid transporter [Nitzschia inconspicua]